VEYNAATAKVTTISHMVGKDDSAATKHTLCSCCTGSTGPSQLQAAARALQKAEAQNRGSNHPKSAKLTVKLQAASRTEETHDALRLRGTKLISLRDFEVEAAVTMLKIEKVEASCSCLGAAAAASDSEWRSMSQKITRRKRLLPKSAATDFEKDVCCLPVRDVTRHVRLCRLV
jgi:hypothetical protein